MALFFKSVMAETTSLRRWFNARERDRSSSVSVRLFYGFNLGFKAVRNEARLIDFSRVKRFYYVSKSSLLPV